MWRLSSITMWLSRALAVFGLSLVACGDSPPPQAPKSAPVVIAPANANELHLPGDFDLITNQDEKSRAIFLEASRVLLHPRCSNCHPSDDSPRQGDAQLLHDPRVARGADDRGVVAMQCTGCHQEANATLARVPGAPNWHLAPKEMAWIGHTPSAICEQLKDPARNGHRTLDQIVDHSRHDSLVAWAWSPGANRTRAPGTQAQFGDLMNAWKNTGAVCPIEEAKK